MGDGDFLNLYGEGGVDVADLIFAEPIRPDQGAVLAWDPIAKQGIYTEGYRNAEQKERARENALRAIRNYERRLGRSEQSKALEAEYARKKRLILS